MLVPADGVEGSAQGHPGRGCCRRSEFLAAYGCWRWYWREIWKWPALRAKRAAAGDVGTQNPDQRVCRFEKDLLDMINKTGIGPRRGLGGGLPPRLR